MRGSFRDAGWRRFLKRIGSGPGNALQCDPRAARDVLGRVPRISGQRLRVATARAGRMQCLVGDAMSGCRVERNVATQARTDSAVRIWQFQPHAKGRAGCVDDLVYDCDFGHMGTADRFLRIDGGDHPFLDRVKHGGGQIRFDMQRIDLRQAQHGGVLMNEFSG